MEQGTGTIDGQRIAYLASSGQGRPVLLVHGNSLSARTWRDLLDGPFGQQHRCLALSLPGHGDSAPAVDPARYTVPGHAAVVAGFARALDAQDAVLVGWSLGGHIALEAASALPGAAGFVIFGTPPISSAADFAVGFLPHPAMGIAFTDQITPDQARELAASFRAPGSDLPLQEFVTEILGTDSAARAGLGASIPAGDFADEVEIAATLGRPLAILHGEGDQVVSLPYLRTLAIPTLWRGEVQVIPGAGHALHREQPAAFDAALTEFVADLP